MFRFIIKKLMKSRNYKKILDFVRGNFLLENVTYSQNSEDLIIEYIQNEKKTGIYVDIGAHHPYRFSNTYKLYLNGWKGINVDPLPKCKELFDIYRPKDINLNVGISNSSKILSYYSFDEPAYNTTNKVRADYLQNNNIAKLKEEVEIKLVKLEKIFDKYIKDKEIDLLTLDVETMELDVLMSNNWERYSPKLIVMESIVSCNEDIMKIYEDKAVKYLLDKDYCVIAKVQNAVFFKKK